MHKKRGQDRLYTLANVSKLTKTPKPFIRQFVSPANLETNIRTNKTTYLYILSDVKDFIESKNGQSLLDGYNSLRGIYKTTTYKNCYVTWFVWYGIKPHETHHKREAYGATVSVKNKTATITLESGETFSKRTYTKGFRFEPNLSCKMPKFIYEVFDFDSYDPDEH